VAAPRKLTRRTPSAAEFKALAHPLRMRILRLCLDEARTNNELADLLDANPATVLHHVRTLVDHGFLVAEPVRTGKRGSREKPYRATGLSWGLELDALPADDRVTGTMVAIDAVRGEVAAAGPEAMAGAQWSRVGLVLGAESVAELEDRLNEVVEDFVSRSPEPGGTKKALFYLLHDRE
jgi:predicted ArsR family transcriptional regulator